MSRSMLSGLALVSLLFIQGFAVAADKEIPLPTLPTGAGTVDKDAPKTFTATTSGLKYRVLRKGTGGKP